MPDLSWNLPERSASGRGMEVRAKVILRSAFYAISRRSPLFLFTLSMTLIPMLERLFLRI